MKIIISAGERSGDEHAAAFLLELRKLAPTSVAFGMGGSALKAAGMQIIVDSEAAGSTMGFQELLGSASKIISSYLKIKGLLQTEKPDLLLLIDYPDFNLRLAAYAKKLGIKTLYYITPKVWAWRSSRVAKIISSIDQAALIFPFEEKFFEERGFKRGVYVGNPVVEQVEKQLISPEARQDFLRQNGLNPEQPVLAILPGSRRNELNQHLTLSCESFSALKKKVPNIQAALALPSKLINQETKALTEKHQIKLIPDQAIKLMQSADLGLIKSGTSNLQAAVCQLPFVMFYIIPPITAWITARLIEINQYSLVNIIRPGSIKELVQEQARPETIAGELERLFCDQAYNTQVKQALAETCQILRTPTNLELFAGTSLVAERVALLALETVK